MGPLQWGDVWSALGALGTLAATGTAVGLAIVERGERQKAEKERDTLRREQVRDQASRIVAWLEDTDVDIFDSGSDIFDKPGYRVTAKNPSAAPVFDVWAAVVYFGGHVEDVLKQRDVLPPQAETEWTVLARPAGPDQQPWQGRPWVRLRFTDASGKRWERAESGRLIVSPDQP